MKPVEGKDSAIKVKLQEMDILNGIRKAACVMLRLIRFFPMQCIKNIIG